MAAVKSCENALLYGLVLHEFSVAQADRAPARCLGGHRFESCGDSDFFLSHARDMLIISSSHLFTELKMYHLPYFHYFHSIVK